MRVFGMVALLACAVPSLAFAGIDQQTLSWCMGPNAEIDQLTRSAEACTKTAGERLAPSGENSADIATAAVAECASDHSFLAMMDTYCRMALGASWQAPDWRNGVRAAAIDGVVTARAAKAGSVYGGPGDPYATGPTPPT